MLQEGVGNHFISERLTASVGIKWAVLFARVDERQLVQREQEQIMFEP
jgi:hypothetical protein